MSGASCNRVIGGEGGVSVGYEDLLVCEAVSRQLHFTTGGPHLSGRLTTNGRDNLPERHS